MPISIHAPRTGSDLYALVLGSSKPISIHAPRTGSDDGYRSFVSAGLYFNPRSPHGERHSAWVTGAAWVRDFNPRSPHGERPPLQIRNAAAKIFQSTLPARGATQTFGIEIEMTNFNPRSPHGERHDSHACHAEKHYFNPRSPHGERLRRVEEPRVHGKISIHAPRTGSDSSSASLLPARTSFQSTLPARGATSSASRSAFSSSNFNPRSPHGERRTGCHARTRQRRIFQSTLPARGATATKKKHKQNI